MLFVGWDRASETHDVTVMDTDGGVVDRWPVIHDAAGIDAALRRLAAAGEPGRMLIAIEARKGLVVDRLLAAGFGVVPIHPKLVQRCPSEMGSESFEIGSGRFVEARRLRAHGRSSSGTPRRH
jgi:Transposase